MRKIAFLVCVIFSVFVSEVISQTTDNFNYQAVVRDNNGELLINQTIGVRLTIQSSVDGTGLYREKHTVTTSGDGQISLAVGSGTSDLGVFNDIDWGADPKFIKIEIDAGNGFVDMGTFQLLSVPYALFAKNVENKDDADPDPENEIQDLNLTDDVLTITNHPSPTPINLAPFTGNNTDEQELDLVGDTLKITNGNQVVLPYDSSKWVIDGSSMYYNDGKVGIGSSSPVSNLEVKATASGSDALFQVINANNDTVFAVYPDGVKIFVDSEAKGKVGGFAISGRSPNKASGGVDILKVTVDSTRFYVSDTVSAKGKVGGFAISGRSPNKGINSDYLVITGDSTRIYVNDTSTVKGKVGGFAISGRSPNKGTVNDYLKVTRDSTRVYVSETGAKGKVGGFAISGRSPNKGLEKDYFNITPNTSAQKIVNETRIMWYPEKSALLAGEIHVGSADSVGENSVAMGYRSIALGNQSQAFGYKSLAYGTFSSALGYEAESNTNSLAVGYLAKANGTSSFAMGYGAVATGDNSYALGSVGLDSAGVVTNNTQAIGEYSFAFGLGSVTTGKGSFAFGTNNTSSGEYSTSIGYKNTASDWFTTSLGANSQATGLYSTAIGFYNQAANTASIALGYFTKANGSSSLATGYQTTADGYSSFAGGYQTTAGGFSAVAMGYFAQAPGDYSFSAGWSTNSSNTASAAFGRITTSGGQYSFVYGYNSSTNASGTYSLAGGNGCAANSAYSVALGRSCTTSASSATAIGYSNTASGLYSVALGRSTTASGDYALSSGYGSSSTGDYSFTFGNVTTAQAYMSAVFGRYNVVEGTTDSWVTTEPIFVVGNGSSGLPHNALTLLKDGNMTIGGLLTQDSDERLKENIKDMDSALPNVLKIKPVYYEFKNKEIHAAGRQIGFIAQNVQKYYPELVSEGADGMLSLDYSRMTVILLKAVKEQQELIEKQQEENESLKAQIEEINKKLDKLMSQ